MQFAKYVPLLFHSLALRSAGFFQAAKQNNYEKTFYNFKHTLQTTSSKNKNKKKQQSKKQEFKPDSPTIKQSVCVENLIKFCWLWADGSWWRKAGNIEQLEALAGTMATENKLSTISQEQLLQQFQLHGQQTVKK